MAGQQYTLSIPLYKNWTDKNNRIHILYASINQA